MKKRRRLLTVSAALLLVAVLNFFLLQYLGDDEPGLIRGWRLFLTILLSLFLALGSNSARWITVILTALGALGGVVAIGAVIASGGLDATAQLLLAWAAFITVVHGYISGFLAFSPGVAREIQRIKERI